MRNLVRGKLNILPLTAAILLCLCFLSFRRVGNVYGKITDEGPGVEYGTPSDASRYADLSIATPSSVERIEVKSNIIEIPEPDPIKGYEFIGWNSCRDGSGDWYYPGELFEMTEECTDFYAVWEKVKKATLSDAVSVSTEAAAEETASGETESETEPETVPDTEPETVQEPETSSVAGGSDAFKSEESETEKTADETAGEAETDPEKIPDTEEKTEDPDNDTADDDSGQGEVHEKDPSDDDIPDAETGDEKTEAPEEAVSEEASEDTAGSGDLPKDEGIDDTEESEENTERSGEDDTGSDNSAEGIENEIVQEEEPERFRADV